MSFLGAVLGGVAGFVIGGPAGAVTGARAGAALGTRGAGMALVPAMPPPVPGGFDNVPGQANIFTRAMPPAPMGMACPPGTRCAGMSMDGLCVGSCLPMGAMGMVGLSGRCPLPAPRGFHWNQKTYCTVKQGVIPKCTRVIKNRHLNPANGRAARRAVRRIAATHKLLKRIEKSIRRIKGVRGAKLSRRSPARAAGGVERVVAVG